MKTIHEIAALANCSARTVSRVMNNSGPVAEKTKDKVLEIAEKYNFKPSQLAQNLRKGRTKKIALIQSSSDSEVNRQRIDVLTGLLCAADYSLLINRARNSQHEKELIATLAPQSDALISVSVIEEKNFSECQSLKEKSYPFILVDPPIKSDYPSIYINRSDAYRDALLELYKKGRRKIALIVQEFRQADRIKGYKEGLAMVGLDFDESLLIQSERSFEGGKISGNKVHALMREKGIDALLCHNDRIALGIIQTLQSYGLRVPEDLSIIGFDNDVYGAYTTPSISTIEQGIDNIAVYIYEQLMASIEKNINIQNRTFNTKIILRQSF